MENNQNKLRRNNSLRLKDYDYSLPGMYFITLCTQEGKASLGDFKTSEVIMSEAGLIADHHLTLLDHKYPSLEVIEHIIMPDHVHAILQLHQLPFINNTPSIKAEVKSSGRPALGQIVAYYKYKTTIAINEQNNSESNRFWQRGYYDHIIRDDEDLANIRQYIMDNPIRWIMKHS